MVIFLLNKMNRSNINRNTPSISNNQRYINTEVDDRTLNAHLYNRKNKNQMISKTDYQVSSQIISPPRIQDHTLSYTRLAQKGNSFNNKKQSNYLNFQHRYQSIQQFLQNQNNNLKQQSQMLVEEMKKIAGRSNKYKYLYDQNQFHIHLISQQRDAYRKQIQELRNISQIKIKELQNKINIASLATQNMQSSFQTQTDQIHSVCLKKQTKISQQSTFLTKNHRYD